MSAETCPRCGHMLPPGANFCPNCGAPVRVPEASERRVVTVAFVDLAGSTELAALLDPERFREVLAAFHGMVSEEVAWLGGVAETFIGDAVLGVFGAPLAHDDDAVRAVRTAVAVRERAVRLGRELGLPMPIRVRIGVNTGQVAVGTSTDRNIVIGAAVNIGARLQQAAAPDEILAGETTVQLAASQVDFGEPRTIEAKGLGGAITGRPVVSLAPGARGDRAKIPMVDRRREMGLLQDIFDRVANRRRAHLVTLTGEPGIGKSRVVEEFLAGLPEGVRVLTGRSSPFEEEVTFWPLAQMVYAQIGRDRDAFEADVLEDLREVVSTWVEPEGVDRAVHGLGLTLGLTDEGDEGSRYQAAEVRRGIFAMIEGLAAHGPVVLVFEDLQDADQLVLELIQQLVKDARRLPLLVVCVARWEFLEREPTWAGGIADAVTLWVEPLAPGHAARLAEEAGGLQPEDAERVAAHAGGNPFFIIEITGMLLRDEGAVPPRGPAPSMRLLPPTVQAVIAARIDHLSPGAREMVRRASVFPQGRFDEAELALVAEPRREWLEEAEEGELLVADGAGEGVWRFRSDVLRDVAYDSLAKRDRQRLHLRVANKLSEPEMADRYPRTVAFHLEQAARASLDLHPGDRTLADRAVDALTRAGDLSRRRIESRTAVDLFQRALALAGPEEQWGPREAWIMAMLGEARYWLGEFDRAEEALRKALGLAAPDDQRVIAHASRFLGEITLVIRGDTALAAVTFERSLEAARRLDNPRALARTLLMAAWVPFWRTELERSYAMFQEALDAARAADGKDSWVECRALAGLAAVTSLRSSEEAALVLAREALAIGEASVQSFSEAIGHQAVCTSLRHLARLEESRSHGDLAVSILRELGARWELAGALGERGATQRAAGRLEEAERDLREAFVLCKDLSEQAIIAWTASELARALSGRGETAAARSVLEDPAVRLADGEPGSAAALLTAEAALALAEGDERTARTKSVAAIAAEGGAEALPNRHAAAVWWTGRLFGADAVGGGRDLADARDSLQRNGWLLEIAEPDQVRRRN